MCTPESVTETIHTPFHTRLPIPPNHPSNSLPPQFNVIECVFKIDNQGNNNKQAQHIYNQQQSTNPPNPD
jgi:hypothetical protein